MVRGLKKFLFCGLSVVCLIFLFNVFKVTRVEDETNDRFSRYRFFPKENGSCHTSQCSVDGSPLTCLMNGSEVYFPFSFLKKKLDVTGKFSKDSSIFEWSTSYSRMRYPDGLVYNSSGVFGHFMTYNVENRDRVRCINGETGVPMSTQWDSTPYYYPIQIAQYGLQHYSRLISNSGNVSMNAQYTSGHETSEWKGSAGDSDTSERIFYDLPVDGAVLNISTSGSFNNVGCYLYLQEDPHLSVVSFEWKPLVDASYTVLVKLIKDNKLVLMNYGSLNDSLCVSKIIQEDPDQMSFTYSIANNTDRWTNVTRDILVDVSRALSSANAKRKDGNVILRTGDIKLVTIGFRGQAIIKRKIVQSSQAHRKFFHNAAQWLVENQDEKGGWSVPVERSIADRKLVLPPGWYSAMAQGHALSLLSRAFLEFQDAKYAASCLKGLDLFNKTVGDGGIANALMGYQWYEEYPTTPGSFVLNGFMYSLIGLYDFSTLGSSGDSTITEGAIQAGKLFNTGLESLRALLPLYDTGSGSIYDLRHIGLKTAPNLARWDYHAVHVYLLKWLVQITGDKQLNETADRWIGYSYGKRAKHN